MANIKIVFFDIDGTLILRNQNSMSNNTLNAIEQLKNQNIKIIIATGRSSYFIQNEIKEKINPDFYITINGQLITNQNFKPVYKSYLDYDECLKVINFCKQNNIGIGAKLESHIEVYNDYNNFLPYYLHGDLTLAHIVKNCENKEISKKIYGLFLIGNEDKILNLNNILSKNILSYAYKNAYEIFDPNISKAKGIEWVLNYYKLSKDEAISFGDGHNDINMIECTKYGVTFNHGHQDIKKVANYIATDVYDGLKYYNLVQ